jgi:hypothetical protein
VVATIEVANENTYYARRTERAGIVEDAVLMEDLSVEVRGIEKLDPQWLVTPKPPFGSKQRRCAAFVPLRPPLPRPPLSLSLEKKCQACGLLTTPELLSSCFTSEPIGNRRHEDGRQAGWHLQQICILEFFPSIFGFLPFSNNAAAIL